MKCNHWWSSTRQQDVQERGRQPNATGRGSGVRRDGTPLCCTACLRNGSIPLVLRRPGGGLL
ncbi:hypothetical protein BC567DRAFT_214376 [Phyllosticta citribraziliensis]